MSPSPDTTGRWLGTIMPLLNQGGPVVALVLLLLGGVTIWWLATTLERARLTNAQLYERLLDATAAQVETLTRYAHCPPSPGP